MNAVHFFAGMAFLLGAPPVDSSDGRPLPEGGISSVVTDVRVHLIKDPFVRDELSLSADQRSRIDALRKDLDAALFAVRDYRPDSKDPEAQPLISRLRTAWAGIDQILTPTQRTRLQQIAWRAEGVFALTRDDLAYRLAIQPQQRKRIAEITRSARKELRELNQSQLAASQDEKASTRARQAIERKQHKLIQDVLTDDQKRQWRRMLGKPFDLSRVKPTGTLAPELRGVDAWINSPPLTLAQLRGDVVVVHFWTFGCINCIRNWPVYERWVKAYANEDFTIIGIHTPEVKHEYDIDRVRRTAREKALSFPIAVDNHKHNWQAWTNRVWPSVYLIDKAGQVRYWWYGELNWKELQGERIMRNHIDELLAEAGSSETLRKTDANLPKSP